MSSNNNCGKGKTNVVNGVTTELLKVSLNAITTTITKKKTTKTQTTLTMLEHNCANSRKIHGK